MFLLPIEITFINRKKIGGVFKKKKKSSTQHKLLKKVITSETLHELQINNVGQHKHGVIHISNCVAIQKVTVTKVLQNNLTSAVPYSTRHLLA